MTYTFLLLILSTLRLVGWIFAFAMAIAATWGLIDAIVRTPSLRDFSRSDIIGYIVILVFGAGMWWLSFHIWLGTLIILMIVAGLATAALAFLALAESTYEKNRTKRFVRRLVGALSALATVLLWVSSYYQNISWLSSCVNMVTTAVLAVPLAVWSGAIATSLLLALILNVRVNTFIDSIWADGNRIDQSHVWRDERGLTFGQPTYKEVYDHQHGYGSWAAATSVFATIIQLIVFGTPILLPMLVVWIVGWYKVWSLGSVIMAIILTFISLMGTIRFRLTAK